MMNKFLIFMFIPIVCYSATNDTTIDSAILKRIYMGNYNYNTILASAPILTMRWASDLNRPVWKNRYGVVYKGLIDASTSSNTPVSRIFYADANGSASSSSELTFSSSKLNITGKITLTDSLNGANASFSGRVIGTDGIFSDTMSCYNAFVSNGITGTGSTATGIRMNTLDGSDTKYLQLAGGGAGSASRGALIELYGNEHASYPGRLSLYPGAGNGTTTGAIYLGGKTYFGTRPSSDSYWDLAFGKYFTFRGYDANESYMQHNVYYNAGWKYRETDGYGATLINIGSGLTVAAATSGTKDSSITFKNGLRVDTTGYVSIGTITATYPLTVKGLAYADSIRTGGAVVGATGTFSGRVTATDFQASDSIIATRLVTSLSIENSGPYVGYSGTFSGRVTADSINSTKGITTSARIKGTDVDVTDSVKAVTGAFSGALTGTTLNTGNGANELYPMNQAVTTTSDVIFNKVTSTRDSTGDLIATDSIKGVTGTYTSVLKSDSLTVVKSITIGTGATGPTATPYKIDLGNTHSDGETADKCKLYFYKDYSDAYGFSVGSSADLQYHAKNTIGSHRFYVDDVEKTRVDNSGIKITGRATATDFEASDSVKGNYGNFTHNVKVDDTLKSNYGLFSNIIANGDGVRFNTKDEVSFIYKDSLNNNTIIGCKYSPGDGNVAGVVISNFTLDSTIVVKTDTVKVKKLVATGGNVVTYSQGTLPLRILGVTPYIDITAKYIKHGDIVTINIDTSITAASTPSNSRLYLYQLPDTLRPAKTVYTSATSRITNNSVATIGAMGMRVQSDGTVYLTIHGATSGGDGWQSSGNKGFERFCFSYPIN